MRAVSTSLGALCLALLLHAWPAAATDLELRTYPEAAPVVRSLLRRAMYEEVDLLGQKVWSPRATDDAARRLEALAAARAATAVVQRHLARAKADLGEHRQAEAALRRAESLDTDALWPLQDWDSYCQERGAWKAQLSVLKRLASRRQAQLEMPGERDRLAKVLRRIALLIETRQLREDPLPYRRQAAELFPERAGAGAEVINWLIERGRLTEALEQFTWARRNWPDDHAELARQELELLFRLERPERAREVLRRELTRDDGLGPTWVWSSFVRQLRERGELSAELRQVRSLLRGEVTPGAELAAAVQLLRAAGDEEGALAAARRALANSDAASSEDTLMLAALFCHLRQQDVAARLLVRVAATSRGEVRDEAQLRLALLLAQGHGPARASGLQALLDSSHLDTGPSVLGGVLSLLLAGPPQPQAARNLALFDARHQRAAQSASLMENLARRRPNWERLPRLERRLISSYRSFGANGTALHASRRFLERHPNHADFFDVGLEAVQVARAAGENPRPLLRQLAQKAVFRRDDDAHHRVLRALERDLARDRRYGEMITAYWSAIDERPDDVRLYNDLLRFMSRHNLRQEQEQVYQRALARFDGTDWSSRYARWLVRNRSLQHQEELTRQMLDELGPSDLARYLADAVRWSTRRGSRAEAQNRFFLEIHREALRRHPGEVSIARSLLSFYGNNPDHAEARLALLARYAPYDAYMREALYVTLARRESLDADIESLAASESLAARALTADFLIRRAEQREARTTLATLASALPGHRDLGLRLVSLEESLGDRERAREVVETQLLARWPVDGDLLTRAGELAIADGDLAAARHAWGRIHQAAPGDRRAHLRAATLFWDYYMFEDAARTLIGAREAISDENLFAFELAAVHESAGNRDPAIREYVRVLAQAARASDSWPPYHMRRRPPEYRRRSGGSDFDTFDEEIEPAETTDGLQHCMTRLVELAGRESDREMVDEVLRDMLTDDPDDHGIVHIRVDVLESVGRWDDACDLLAESALRINEPSLQDRAIRRLDAAGRARDATAVLQRLAQNRPLDLTPTFRLADYLERRRHIAAAAAALRALAQRLGGDENRRRDQERVQVRLARLLYANQRFDEAVTEARLAIELAEGEREQRMRVEVGHWLNRLERNEAALAVVAPVLAAAPSDSAALDVKARALVALGREGGQDRQEVARSLVAAFDDAIENERRTFTRAAARPRVRRLRETLARHLAELGVHRAVLDQHVALLNVELENRALLHRAFRHAAAHDLVENLEGRYQRDAERSPRDHRLPLVLARLAAAQRQHERAAELMEQSLAIAPERLDLRREMIDYLLRQINETLDQGGWREAARQYRQLAELEQANGDSGDRWIAAEARMYGRVGDWAAMNEAVERLVTSDESDPERRLRAADLYAKAGRWPDAWTQTRTYLEYWQQADERRLHRASRYSSALALSKCAELAVRSGRWREGSKLLERLEISWRETSRQPAVSNRYSYQRLAQLAQDARTRGVARSLATYGVDSDRTDFVAEVRRELAAVEPAGEQTSKVPPYLATAELAALAGVHRTQLELLEVVRGRLKGDDRQTVLRHTSARLEELGALRELRELAESGAFPQEERLPILLRTAAALGDREAEEHALRDLLAQSPEPSFDNQGQQLERLLFLRWNAGSEGRRSIPDMVTSGVNIGGQIINFLLQRGDHRGAREALERFGENEGDSLWMDTARAKISLHEAQHRNLRDDHEPFARALDLRPIGELIDRPAKRRQALTGEAWANLARPYGLALARLDEDNDEESAPRRRLEHAGIELRPRSVEAHVQLANAALTRTDKALALTHFRLARQLAPRSLSVQEGLARALLANGRQRDALALWDRVIAGCSSERCVGAVARSMVRAGVVDEAVARLEQYLRRHWRRGDLSLRLLQQLAAIHGERGQDRGGPMDRLVWDLWLLDRSRHDLLGGAAGVAERGRSSRLLRGRARGRYLRQGLRTFGPESYLRGRWVEAYVDYLIEFDEHQALLELLDRYAVEREASRRGLSVNLQLAHVRGMLGMGRQERAMTVLNELAEAHPEAAVRLLRDLGLEREAWELQYENSERRLEEGREERAVYTAAVEALLELGRDDEAVALARQGVSARADDLPMMRSLSDLLAEHERHLEALELRRIVYRIERADYENLLEMARLEWALGRRDRARTRALSLLARWAVPAQVEAEAGELLVEIGAGRRMYRQPVIAGLTDALAENALDEDRVLVLARILHHSRNRRAAHAVLERSIRESASPWRSLQLLASWEVRAGNLEQAERELEAALVHAGGAWEVRRQLFIVRRRMGHHQAALAIVGIHSDRPAGEAMLRGLDDDEAIALAAEIADSASQVDYWTVADAYARAALERIDEEENPDRARAERARIHAIRMHLDARSAAARGRPWVRRRRGR